MIIPPGVRRFIAAPLSRFIGAHSRRLRENTELKLLIRAVLKPRTPGPPPIVRLFVTYASSRNPIERSPRTSRVDDLLTSTVRAHLQSQVEPMIGGSRHATPEVVDSLIRQKTDEALVVLRETHAAGAIPTEDEIARASLEAIYRNIENMIPKMRDPVTQDPLRREILSDLADGAEIHLARRKALGLHASEEERAELTKDAVERFRALNEKIKAGRPRPEPPAPQ